MGAINSEVWFALTYGAFLLIVAHILDLLARRTATKTTAARSGGFSYHEDHDAWKCSEDQWLWPISFDPDNRVTRYQASATVCNPCPVKDTCTTSDTGRQLARNIDPWPSSEAERFHRGIACAVVVLGLVWPLATMLQQRTGVELVILGAAAVIIALGSWPLWSHLRRSPAGFPAHLRHEGLDESVASREAARVVEVARGYGNIRKTGPRQVPGPAKTTGDTVRSSYSARWTEREAQAEADPGLSGAAAAWTRGENR
jgi:hypothetical protein